MKRSEYHPGMFSLFPMFLSVIKILHFFGAVLRPDTFGNGDFMQKQGAAILDLKTKVMFLIVVILFNSGR